MIKTLRKLADVLAHIRKTYGMINCSFPELGDHGNLIAEDSLVCEYSDMEVYRISHICTAEHGVLSTIILREPESGRLYRIFEYK